MKYLKGNSRLASAFAAGILKEKYALELDVFQKCACKRVFACMLIDVCVCEYVCAGVCLPATGITILE